MEDVALVANFQFGAFPMTMLGAARSILRIDHAGELTARCIYEGQLSVLRIMDPKIVPLVEVFVILNGRQCMNRKRTISRPLML